jgi:hypothetical protein
VSGAEHGTAASHRAEATAERLMDENAIAVESHEGVRLLLALAYLHGDRDGAEAAMAFMRAELGKLS